MADGREIMQANFDTLFANDPRLIAFGEDVGKIGDVNQGFAGLQAKYGETRISDTGIREATIVGQGIGAALRGLKPIAEIQYLDYLLYGIQTLSDDLATLQYRTKGGQKAPLIIRTRGHRLEGIWHSGSPKSWAGLPSLSKTGAARAAIWQPRRSRALRKMATRCCLRPAASWGRGPRCTRSCPSTWRPTSCRCPRRKSIPF